MTNIYIIRKSVRANGIEEALKKERRAKVEEIYLSDESLKSVLDNKMKGKI